MIILALIGAIMMGLVLGLIGAGGAIVTIPILVYMLKINPNEAVIYSFFIIGILSTSASIPAFLRREIDLRALFWFGIPSILSIFLIRLLILPEIPNAFFRIGKVVVYKDNVLMIMFGFLLIWSALKMLSSPKYRIKIIVNSNDNFRMILIGLFVGVLTGLFGTGGGFILIPALVLFLKLDMKLAIATSLAIISINTIMGFIISYQSFENLNWNLIFGFTSCSIGGMIIGIKQRNRFDSNFIKNIFGYLLLIVSVLILFMELRTFIIK